MRSSLRSRAEQLTEATKELTNKLIAREISFEAIANINSDDLKLLKEVSELLEDSYVFACDTAEMLEETNGQVDEIRCDVKEMNRKLNEILRRMDKKEED